MGTVESAIRSLIRRAASGYIAGPSLDHAREVCAELGQKDIASIVCYWDAYADAPEFVSQAYVKLLGAMVNKGSDCYLSVKAPALRFDFELVKKVLDEARRRNAIVHFDAMAPDTVDRTFDLIAQARKIYPKLGYTLPGRWRRSLSDIDRAMDLGLRVRVVKGEWKGSGNDESDPRKGFLNVIERLAPRATHVAVATHNPTVARGSLQRLTNAGTSCELELLYGLPQHPLMKIAQDFGVRVRMYVPYGHAGLPYRLKEAGKNPRVISWFLHDLLRGNSAGLEF